MTARVVNEPLTYRQDAPYSWFMDQLLGGQGAEERLARHAKEMDVLRREQEEADRRRFEAAGLEYRVEPNPTSGQGQSFTPPAWLNQYFAMANRPGRVLSALIQARFPLPSGVTSINVPIIGTGTLVQPTEFTSGVPDQDITDSAGSSSVVTLSGNADVAVQLIEQSPAGAHTDWAIFSDLTAAYDYDLETQLIAGLGSAYQQLLGITQVGGSAIAVSYTSASPTGPGMWPYMAQVFSQIGDARDLPPECWLVRTARWGWFMGQEDTATLPLGVLSPFFLGSTDDTPNPIGAWFGLPVFLDDAISATNGTAANQDQVLCVRPSDMMLLEGTPRTAIFREPGSSNLSARVQLRNYAAAITNRHPAGIGVLSGTGLAVQSGY